MSHVLRNMPLEFNMDVACSIYQFGRIRELEDRRMYLYGSINSKDLEEVLLYEDVSMTGKIVERIIDYNRLDEGIAPEKREPIRLYINSPGGEVSEGFALVDVMRLSKTPIYTINLGEWYSMAFLIGITGTKRFSLPSATFMMHEPSGLTVGKFSDMADRVKFNQRFGENIIKQHVMSHSKMTSGNYDAISTKDFYMLAESALDYGFIDEIVSDINTIL